MHFAKIADILGYHNFSNRSIFADMGKWRMGFHPYALQDPYVTVSRHTAPTVQSTAESQNPKT